MKKVSQATLAVLLLLLITGISNQLSAKAHLLPDHPAYLHALSDLRAARWNLEHRPGNWKQTEDEVAAVKEIDAAIGEIKKAGIDDHKDLNDHPKDEVNDHVGRLHKASEFLHKADNDVDEHESNEAAKGLRERAHQHIREAIHRVDNALKMVH